ncbi:MAG: archaellin/type IV pilin N-terminal domain-containing protein [Candidatus Pacearchaeota archaeon]
MKKRGISPVVATVLLITIAIIVVAIIWVWAKSSVKEGTLKFNKPIEQSCKEVSLEISINGDSISVVNKGNVAVKKIALKDTLGELYTCNEVTTPRGGTASSSLSSCGASGRTIKSIIPVLEDDKGEDYNCRDNEITSF